MENPALAEASNSLFSAAVIAYAVAAIGYFFRLGFTRVSTSGAQMPTRAGVRLGIAATALASAGVVAHGASIVLRGVAAGRPPLLNMYEFSSLIGFIAVLGTLLFVQWRMRQTDVVGFILAAVVLSLAVALRLFVEAGPVQPALDTWWRWLHISTIGFSSAVFMMGAVAGALYLVKDTAERRVAATGDFGPRSAGAAQLPTRGPSGRRSVDPAAHDAGDRTDVTDGSRPPDGGLAVGAIDGLAADAGEMRTDDGIDRLAQRRVLRWRTFLIVGLLTGGGVSLLSGDGVLVAGTYAAALGAFGLVTWWSVPYLPAAGSLDTLAYRVNAFGFPLWTFAVIIGAMWAEVAWGRYWGWDPKETSAFFTWVFYAAYLHARATRGWQGRRAAWLNIVAFGSVLVTYYVVNLVVVGLHSYAQSGG